MPRFARVVLPDCLHHVTQRGNARRDVFFTPADRQVYLGLLKQYSSYYRLRTFGFCLMTNHVHLVVAPVQEQSLAKTLREVHGRYASYRNAIEHATGHVWQSRYYSCVFEGQRMASVMRYVELNPVRAGLVRSAGDYAWSSALMHLGGIDPLKLLDLESWQCEWTPAEWAEVLDAGAEENAAIRAARFGGRPLGSEQFVTELEHRLNRKLTLATAGRHRKESALALV